MPITNEEELKESYDAIWSETTMEEDDSFYEWIAELLNIQSDRVLLDVGYGSGQMLKFAAKRGAKTYGTDISEVAKKIAKANSPESILEVFSGEKLLYKTDAFDYVTCLGVLEHMIHPEVGVQEIARVVKPDGKVIISLPNKWYWYDVLRGMTKGVDAYQGQELERYYPVEEAKDLMEDNGLRVERVIPFCKELWETGPLAWVYGKFIRKLVPVNASYEPLYVCVKGESPL